MEPFEQKTNYRLPAFILIALLTAIPLGGVAITTILDRIQNPPTPEPTIDMIAINLTAIYIAWLPVTQTAAAIPTNTIPPTETPLPTETRLPTNTSAPLPTPTLVPLPTATYYYVPPPTQPVQSPKCICNRDAYNCDDAMAVTCFYECKNQGYGDVHRLDGDKDGQVCE